LENVPALTVTEVVPPAGVVAEMVLVLAVGAVETRSLRKDEELSL
jgi:hypothetical protein